MLKVSIAMATYNGEKFIQKQLESILKQSFMVYEIVICDDASKDKTVEIADNILAKSHVKYRIIRHKKNQGVVENFWEAIYNTTGDVIFLSDQDDYWISDKIKIFVHEFESNSAAVLAFSNALIADDNLKTTGVTLWDSIKYDPDLSKLNSLLKGEMLKRNVFTGMCMAFRRKLLNYNICFSDSMLHDECIGWTAIKNSEIICIKKPLVYYRQHSNNVVGDSNIRKFESINKTVNYIIKSSNKTSKKFKDLLEYLEDDEMATHQIKEALEFYQWRSKIIHKNKIDSFKNYLNFISKGYYAKYTSKTEHAIFKDIFCLIFG